MSCFQHSIFAQECLAAWCHDDGSHSSLQSWTVIHSIRRQVNFASDVTWLHQSAFRRWSSWRWSAPLYSEVLECRHDGSEIGLENSNGGLELQAHYIEPGIGRCYDFIVVPSEGRANLWHLPSEWIAWNFLEWFPDGSEYMLLVAWALDLYTWDQGSFD